MVGKYADLVPRELGFAPPERPLRAARAFSFKRSSRSVAPINQLNFPDSAVAIGNPTPSQTKGTAQHGGEGNGERESRISTLSRRLKQTRKETQITEVDRAFNMVTVRVERAVPSRQLTSSSLPEEMQRRYTAMQST
jgi:hypothetical protein